MRKLIVVGTLLAAFAFPLASKAEVNAFGVQLPVGNYGDEGNAKGGYVAKDLNDTFHVQMISEEETPKPAADAVNKNAYTVYGIHLSGNDVI
ncbi:MAG TPA: hypothetical protein VHC46_00535 [Thermodesulfobacteriota bacterium]|nr:hypothetical protein [Thermodesulfobacteriota bacterium]